VIWQVEAA